MILVQEEKKGVRRVVFEVGVLNQDDLAAGPRQAGPDRRALAAVCVVRRSTTSAEAGADATQPAIMPAVPSRMPSTTTTICLR